VLAAKLLLSSSHLAPSLCQPEPDRNSSLHGVSAKRASGVAQGWCGCRKLHSSTECWAEGTSQLVDEPCGETIDEGGESPRICRNRAFRFNYTELNTGRCVVIPPDDSITERCLYTHNSVPLSASKLDPMERSRCTQPELPQSVSHSTKARCLRTYVAHLLPEMVRNRSWIRCKPRWNGLLGWGYAGPCGTSDSGDRIMGWHGRSRARCDRLSSISHRAG
jgi:hypothetical protein